MKANARPLRACGKYGAASAKYITGASALQSSGVAFSSDYDLPNDLVYAESCASIGLMMFARRMLKWKPIAKVRRRDGSARVQHRPRRGALDGKYFSTSTRWKCSIQNR